jgi:hypothetical protein
MKRERISSGDDFLMKLAAACFDVVGTLLNATFIGGTIVGLFGDLTFFLWYMMIGGKIMNPRTLRRAGAMSIIELIPLINVVPSFSLFVWKTNKSIRKEDEEYNLAEEEKIKKSRAQTTGAAITQYNEQVRQKQLAENPNRIFDLANDPTRKMTKEGIDTNPDSVYRSVTGYNAVRDLVGEDEVRNAHSAGVKKGKNRWGNTVYWTKGSEGDKLPVSRNSDHYILETPHSVASQRKVTKKISPLFIPEIVKEKL